MKSLVQFSPETFDKVFSFVLCFVFLQVAMLYDIACETTTVISSLSFFLLWTDVQSYSEIFFYHSAEYSTVTYCDNVWVYFVLWVTVYSFTPKVTALLYALVF